MNLRRYRDFWEPVFHPVISGGWIYLPGRGGSIWKLDKATGKVDSRINPFPPTRGSEYLYHQPVNGR